MTFRPQTDRSRPRRVLIAALLSFVASFSSAPAEDDDRPSPVTIVETLWGFDGKGMRSTFLPLSVQVQNPTAKSVSGTLTLKRQSGMGRQADVPVEAPFDVPPFEQRWVQMGVLVVDEYDSFTLAWGAGKKDVMDVTPPRMAEPAVVLLQNESELRRAAGVVRRFSTDVFPPSVTMTDQLDAVVLDSVPEFQGARLQSFLEWLERGGRVFIAQDDQRRDPRFPAVLAILNNPEKRFFVKAGLVQRLDMPASEIDNGILRNTLMRQPPDARSKSRVPNDVFSDYGSKISWDRDRPILSDLQSMSRFYRRWWLIYPLALLYLMSLYPGTYLIGRGVPDVRWFYASFLGSAALASVAFVVLGGLGSNEQDRIRSATIAHALADGTYDVTQWLAVGAVSGGMQTITHKASGRQYALGDDAEVVPGRAVCGAEARLEVDVPPGSIRPAVCRFRAEGPRLPMTITTFDSTEQSLQSLGISVEGLHKEILSAYAAWRDQIYEMHQTGDMLFAQTQRPQMTAVQVSRIEEWGMSTPFRIVRPLEEQPEKTDDEYFLRLERRLIGNAFGLTHEIRRESTTMPPGILRVMIFINDSKPFTVDGDGFPDRKGCVLYVNDLPVSAH